MTTSPSQSPSFPGLTGESRKALDARLRPAGMTRQQEWNFRVGQFNNEILNKWPANSSDNSMDRVLCSEGPPYLPGDAEEGLSELARISKRGVIFSLHNEGVYEIKGIP
jgi:hypothetical protein